ncbi:MAG: FHA domain-containing protein [Gammaproteobacteria bacterium]
MAKFTVFFKEAPIQSELFESGVVHIGRDSTNDIVIDSLAIAPVHAAAIIKPEEVVIKQLNEEFPLFVNGQKTKECQLRNNDKISIGKHFIIFNVSEFALEESNHATPETVSVEKLEPREANLQIIGGQHIGRIIPLKKSMTRLGGGGKGIIIISKRKDGYFISALEGHPSLKVNNQPLGDNTFKLNNNDKIVIDNTPMQFFHT